MKNIWIKSHVYKTARIFYNKNNHLSNSCSCPHMPEMGRIDDLSMHPPYACILSVLFFISGKHKEHIC